MYIILEIQTNTDSTVGTLVQTSDDRNHAESIYHHVLAAAALSSLPKHSAMLVTDEGFTIMSQCYEHPTE